MGDKRIDEALKKYAAKGLHPCPLCGRLVGRDRDGRVNVHGGFGESCPAGGKRLPEGKTEKPRGMATAGTAAAYDPASPTSTADRDGESL